MVVYEKTARNATLKMIETERPAERIGKLRPMKSKIHNETVNSASSAGQYRNNPGLTPRRLIMNLTKGLVSRPVPSLANSGACFMNHQVETPSPTDMSTASRKLSARIFRIAMVVKD